LKHSAAVQPRIAVLVPCRNEAATVQRVVREFGPALQEYGNH
jgi:hypothetical protein